jgi:hypothetical protein
VSPGTRLARVIPDHARQILEFASGVLKQLCQWGFVGLFLEDGYDLDRLHPRS